MLVMKINNLIKYFVAVLPVLFASCSQRSVVPGDGEGSVSLSLCVASQTKAMSQDELLSEASVNIYKADFSGLIRSYKYSEVPSAIYLPAESYRVDVIAGEAAKSSPVKASWDSKSYFGSTSFDIIAGQNTSVQVLAGVSNVVSVVSFDATVAENFNEGFSFTVGTDIEDSASSLVYDLSRSAQEGYFIVDSEMEPSLKWRFSGTLANDGSSFVREGVIPDVECGKAYRTTVRYTVKDGELSMDLMVDYSTEVVEDMVVFEPVSTGLSQSRVYEIWAARAYVHADVDESEYSDPSLIKFSYKASHDSQWQVADATRVAEGLYDGVLTGLVPSTEYEYRLVIDGQTVGESLSFTTDEAPALPNHSFEYISLVSGKSYYKWYDPSCGVPEGETMFWGSGNGEGSEGVNGSASMGIVITAPSEDAVDGNYSVCAQSSSLIGILAAGNIFTGQFAGLEGTSGGKVNFGRPWTSRPTALRIWVKYSAGTINIVKNVPEGVTVEKNVTYDCANIQVAIGTWNYRQYGGTKDSPVHINTTNSATFVDFTTDASTIAYGEYTLSGDGYEKINGGDTSQVNPGEWRQITIPLDYRNMTDYPTHIIISCASSIYGNYFTGCDSAKLYLDNAELIYE